MPSTTFSQNIPLEFVDQQAPVSQMIIEPEAALKYVTEWKNRMDRVRKPRRDIWDECWQLYRGLEDLSDKASWQSKLTIPKAWSSVKQASSVISRLLNLSARPWGMGPANPTSL